MSIQFLIPLIILLPWLGSVVVWGLRDRNEKPIHLTASAFSIVSALISVLLTFQISDQQTVFYSIGAGLGNLTFSADAMGIILVLIANCIGSLAVIFSFDYLKGERDLSR